MFLLHKKAATKRPRLPLWLWAPDVCAARVGWSRSSAVPRSPYLHRSDNRRCLQPQQFVGKNRMDIQQKLGSQHFTTLTTLQNQEQLAVKRNRWTIIGTILIQNGTAVRNHWQPSVDVEVDRRSRAAKPTTGETAVTEKNRMRHRYHSNWKKNVGLKTIWRFS